MFRRSLALLCSTALAVTPALACTDVRIMAKDGSAMTVRTMEFGVDLKSDVVVVPRGQKVSSIAPKGDGLGWTSKYGFVGMNVFDAAFFVDGLNEKGLGIGALYLPGETEYQKVAPGDEARALANADFVAWVLGNFENAAQVRDALQNVVVWGPDIPQLGSFAPLHFAVHDKSGGSIIVEYVGGELQVYDNDVGVLTNSPAYPWHLQNLRNYVNLTAVNADPVKIGDVTYVGTGQGSGLRGLPGDPTPPSRFVMAAATSHLANKPNNSEEALVLAMHLIDRVDIPKGLVRDYSQGGKPAGDYTQWTAFRDHANKVYFWRSYDDPSMRAIDLSKIDFDASQPARSITVGGGKPSVEMLSIDRLATTKTQSSYRPTSGRN